MSLELRERVTLRPQVTPFLEQELIEARVELLPGPVDEPWMRARFGDAIVEQMLRLDVLRR